MEEKKLIIIALHLTMAILILVISEPILRKRARKVQSLHRKYIVQLIRLIVILVCITNIVAVFNPDTGLDSLLIKGSALIVGIVGFAGQTAISDVICGLLISFNKPFEVGDRIIIEGEQPGIVEDITLRHTVLKIYDDIKIIVPNSVLNSKTVTNTSYRMRDRRGIHLRYSVSYDTDVSKAMDIIRDCVAESPYTLGVVANGVKQDSGPVYFLEFAESALVLDTTIWIDRNTVTYMATTDINLRVNEAFRKNGIEIPYNYLNVVSFEGVKKETADIEERKKTLPSKRYFRTNNVRLNGGEDELGKAIEEAKHYVRRQRLNARNGSRIELLAEEAIGIVRNITEDALVDFWIEGSGMVFRLHLAFKPDFGSKEYKKLINLSSSGRNEAIKGLSGKLREIVFLGIAASQDRDKSYKWSMAEDSINEDEIGESLLAAVADDIRVSVTKEKVELIVEKLVSLE